MKTCLFCIALLVASAAFSQKLYYNRIFTARELQKPPQYPYGADSCVHFYFNHFEGLDSVLTKVIAMGDTAKYIRVYFSFIISEDGTPYDAKFLGVGSTQYAKSAGVKYLKYFDDDANKKYYNAVIRRMFTKMTFWKPGIYNGLPVDCLIHDYVQFWVGIEPPRF